MGHMNHSQNVAKDNGFVLVSNFNDQNIREGFTLNGEEKKGRTHVCRLVFRDAIAIKSERGGGSMFRAVWLRSQILPMI